MRQTRPNFVSVESMNNEDSATVVLSVGKMSGFIDNNRFRKLLLAVPSKAIGLLYDHFYQALVDFAITLVHDRKTAEDIVQETFIHVWEKRKKLGQPDNRLIEHYLIRVVRNKAISRYKNDLKRCEAAVKKYNWCAQLSVEQNMISLETTTEIRNLILTFPRRETECLLLRIDEALTTREIAERLKVSRKAVERSLTSANKRIRKYLKDHGHGAFARQ